MSFPNLIAGALLLGSLAAGGLALAGPDALSPQAGAPQTASEEGRETMSMAEILRQLSARGYGEVREIEREGARYEVKARDREGRWRELYVDARTGEVLAEEEDDD